MKTYPVIRLLLCVVFTTGYCFGQSPINSFTTVSNIVVAGGTSTQTIRSHANSVNNVLPNTNYTVRYNNNGNVNISSFTLSGKTFVKFAGFDTVILRRVANTWETTGGNKQHIYVQGAATVDNTTYNMPFPAAFPVVTNYNYMERVMKQGYINRGSDNIFNNDPGSDLTFNNIERVDFVYKTGISTTALTTAGFLIAERGGNDPFKIAAITGIDVNGNPTSFGAVKSVGTASYGATMMSTATYVMRKDPADNTLRPFSLVASQGIKSVFMKFSDLGITPLQKVYGYALMAGDVTATTSAQVLGFTNATYFPRTTTTADGGIDLASAPGIFHTDLILSTHALTLTTQAKNCQQVLQWSDENFEAVKEYQVQKSLNGEAFEKLAVVNSIAGSKNSYTDNNSSACYYRIKAVLLTGEENYSPIVLAGSSCAGTKVFLYPNPAKNMLTLSYDEATHIRQVTIFSLSGKEIGKWNVNENSRQIQLDISALPQGHYFVRLSDANGSQKPYPFMKL